MNKSPMFTPIRKYFLAISGVILLVASLLPMETSRALTQGSVFFHDIEEHDLSEKLDNAELLAEPVKPSADHPAHETFERRVQSGDTLSSIFQASGASVKDLYRIMEADAEYLSLETLTPGTKLSLTFDHEGDFSALTLHLDVARKVVYSKQSDGSFVHQTFEADTHWVSEVLRGSVKGSFYNSALRSGLTRSQVLLIDQLLGNQLNFRRDLRAGDAYAVIVDHEMLGEQTTGNTRLGAVSFTRGKKTYNAFRFDDGNYYDESGESVTPAFLRWPTDKPYRVSSVFNRNRLHPITGRRSPHNGVDLATPIGTSIFSTGDGIVRRVGNHRYAGKYIDIDHGGSHTTRYLHLQKILVRKGAHVERGQKVALSGNTGRSTGPHLHFELHINGRPVDPLTADIPTAAAIPETAAARFEENLREQMSVMAHAISRSEFVTAESQVMTIF
ncbi:peptidoglycan DD-metalloendopeptidase family protein [Marinobacter sp. AL4B]|uniref:peptidoglycan DD-metalloendopeptidase family protein n=1 Tax=Marinobacter sp. AL4B TaxID=2871173 RepID=UPI0021CDC875|nr:peptidoglycan DD-metalloendopeptidase family protein [Marinobacter sp. AL4B]